MEIGKKFNTLTSKEYFFYIDNHKKFKDFNSLGLYRSIVENEKLTLEDKIAVREYAHNTFRNAFDFLQIKDPKTYIEVENLGIELTNGDKQRIWDEIQRNQQKILADKRIKHRNFGIHSKHIDCGDETCAWKGIMTRQDSWLAEQWIWFKGDRNKYQQKIKSDRRKKERKKQIQTIDRELDAE